MANARRQLVLCLRNTGYEVSLERRKIYGTIPDPDARRGLNNEWSRRAREQEREQLIRGR